MVYTKVNILSIKTRVSKNENEYFQLKCQDLKSRQSLNFILLVGNENTQNVFNSLFKVQNGYRFNVEEFFSYTLNRPEVLTTVKNRFVRNPYEIGFTGYPFNLQSLREVVDDFEEVVKSGKFTLNRKKQ